MPEVVTPYKKAIRQPIPEIAQTLQEALGQRLVAYAVGIKSPKLVGRWAAGDGNPRDDAATRLRDLYRVFVILHEQYDDQTIRAFLMGSHPDLQDRTPVDVIREGQGVEAIHAAAAFLD